MKRGELEQELARWNPWWRTRPGSRPWEADDPDLRAVGEAPFSYEPRPLEDLAQGGLYMLLGPRRVGKSVELKRAVSRALASGMDRRRVISASCDGWLRRDLATLVDAVDGIAPPSGGPRFIFLDEITAIKQEWVSQVKSLRDNTALRRDCVVLSGSSAERLEEARKAFAGRRGKVERPDRTLLPMGFRAFCAVSGIELPQIPTVHPRDMLKRPASDAIQELRVYLHELVPAWERYLEVGGFPQAVSDWASERQVSSTFLEALWDVIQGDAFRAEWAASETQKLLELIAQAIGSPFNASDVARELGHMHHESLRLRLSKLVRNYIVWPCAQNQGGRPKLNARRKLYFLDPLHARLATLRRPEVVRPPDYTQLTEQQLGVTLLRANETEDRGTLTEYDAVLYQRSSTGREIDFTGPWLRGLPYESKYTEGRWLRATATATAAYGKCVVATRNAIGRDEDRLAVPMPILALLLDPTPLAAGRQTG